MVVTNNNLGGASASADWSTGTAGRLAACRPARLALAAAAVIACTVLAGGVMAPARVGAGTTQALRTRVLPTAAGSLTDKAAARARADLDAVLSGGWADVDLAPVDALATALLRHYNVSRLKEGHSGQVVIERKVYYALASMPSIRTICEIGFNGGHSAALWLHANPAAQVYMFDLWEHEYSPRGEAFLRGPAAAALGIRNADARLHIIKGPSQVTVPAFATEQPGVRCDLLSVDGAHNLTLALADIANMAQLAARNFNILVVDDTNCASSWCVDGALEEHQRRGMVRRLAGFAEHLDNDKAQFTRGVTVAQYLTSAV